MRLTERVRPPLPLPTAPKKGRKLSVRIFDTQMSSEGRGVVFFVAWTLLTKNKDA